jgi:hypothetical protein
MPETACLVAPVSFVQTDPPAKQTDNPGDDVEHNLYRHPLAQQMPMANSGAGHDRVPSRKSFDIYSLGVLLCEIAAWATVDRVLGIDFHKRPSVVLRVRELLLADRHMSGLGAEAGAIYEAAARKCIAFADDLGLAEGDDETEDGLAARLSVAFYEGVVKALGGIRV